MPIFKAKVSRDIRQKLDDMKFNMRQKTDKDFLEHLVKKWWIEPGPTAETNATTVKSWLDIWLENTRLNMVEILNSNDVSKLFPPKEAGYGGHGIVIGGGPSISRDDSQLRYIAENYHEGVIFCCDFSLKKVLDCGIQPTYIVSVDAEPGTVARFIDHDIVRKKTGNTKYIVATSSHPDTLKVIPGEKYFFTPAMEERILPNVTLTLHKLTGKTILNPAFNVGAFSWILSINMKIKHMLLIGMEHAYPSDTTLDKTQKWESFIQILGGKPVKNKDGTCDAEWPCETCKVPVRKCTEGKICTGKLTSFFFRGHNDFFNTDYLCDSSWITMRNAFMKLVDLAKKDVKEKFNTELTLHNASPTGILHGDVLPQIRLEDWVTKYAGPQYTV